MAIDDAPVRDDPFVARQRAEFMKLIDQINRQPALGRQVFAYLLQLEPGKRIGWYDLANGITQKVSYLQAKSTRYRWFRDQGLIDFEGDYNNREFYSCAEETITEKFGRLDRNWMMRQLGQVKV